MTLDERTTAWLADVLPGVTPIATPLTGGYRNDTLLLENPDGRWVLRRFRHDNRAAVEAALARRLRGVVPVPEVLAADPDGTATGQPSLVVEHVDGTPGDAALARLHDNPDTARELGEDVGRTLAAIGTVTFACPGDLTSAELIPKRDSLPGDLAGFVTDCMRSPHVPLSDSERAALITLAEEWAPLAGMAAAQLVHSDFNPKNLLVRNGSVRAVLDWEFAFSGSPLVDVGNMLRFADDHPSGYADGFVTGFETAGGHLPDGWRDISRALDLFALADLLTRKQASPITTKVTGLVRELLTRRD